MISVAAIEPKPTKTNQLTNRQRAVIPYLIGARSLEEARRKAHVAKATFYGWLKEETFQAELKKQQGQVVTEALERLKAGVTEAVEGLVALMKAEEKSIKLRACQGVLKFTLRAKEMEELIERLTQDGKAGVRQEGPPMREIERRIEKVDWLLAFSSAKCRRWSSRRRNFLFSRGHTVDSRRTATATLSCQISQQEPHEQVQCVIIRGIPAETVIIGMGAIETVVDDVLK
jgi:hypothetical protein